MLVVTCIAHDQNVIVLHNYHIALLDVQCRRYNTSYAEDIHVY